MTGNTTGNTTGTGNTQETLQEVQTPSKAVLSFAHALGCNLAGVFAKYRVPPAAGAARPGRRFGGGGGLPEREQTEGHRGRGTQSLGPGCQRKSTRVIVHKENLKNIINQNHASSHTVHHIVHCCMMMIYRFISSLHTTRTVPGDFDKTVRLK